MIDDRIEEGLSEEEAVGQIGPVGDVVSQIVADIPLTKLVREKIKPKRKMRAWEIILLVLGFPLWFPLLIAAAAVLLALYIVLWALVICLWAIEIAFWACAIAGIVMAVGCFVQGNYLTGVASLGAALILAAPAIFLFFACKAASKGAVKLAKKIAIGIKSLFIRKERTK